MIGMCFSGLRATPSLPSVPFASPAKELDVQDVRLALPPVSELVVPVTTSLGDASSREERGVVSEARNPGLLASSPIVQQLSQSVQKRL